LSPETIFPTAIEVKKIEGARALGAIAATRPLFLVTRGSGL
jgi:hypothetical protein